MLDASRAPPVVRIPKRLSPDEDSRCTMRRVLALILVVTIVGCSSPEETPPAAGTSIATTTPAPAMTTTPATATPTQEETPPPATGTTPPPTPTVTPSPVSPPPAAPPAVPTTANITFHVKAAGIEELDVRFPVFWGPSRRPDVHMMPSDDGFTATVELPLGALVRYEYSVPVFDFEHREQFAPNSGVDRAIVVAGPRTVEDETYVFESAAVPRPARLHGRVTDATSGEPVLEAFVVADGIIASTIDGWYDVAVRERPFLVTVFTPDGSHAAVTREALPGVMDVQLVPAAPARVRIEASASPPAHHEVRVYSTAAQTGPLMHVGNALRIEVYRTLWNGTLELDLHEGQWVDYLYTVGNTVASYEHRNGAWVIRGFAAKDGLVLRDVVGDLLQPTTTWFNVTVPEFTSPTDIITIRKFDPRILAMHRVDADSWTLAYSGEDPEGRTYRYAKTWAGVGDEETFSRTVRRGANDDVVEAWKFQDAPIPTANYTIPAVKNQFRVPVTLPDWYGHEHALAIEPWLRDIAAQGFHGVVLNEVWGYTVLDPTPRIERAGPGFTLYMPVDEAERATALAHALGLRVALEQQLVGVERFLSEPRESNESWWRAWLVEIERFNVQNARMAQAAGIDAIVVAGAQPGLLYPASFAPEYDAGMERVIAAMREVYDGEIVAAYDEFRAGPLDHWKSADRLTQVTYDLRMPENATQAQIDAWVANVLDTRYKSQSDSAGLPMTIKFGVQSTEGAVTGRIVPESEGPATEMNEIVPLDLEEQRMVYEAFFKAANDRPWLAEINVWVYGPTDGPQTRDVDTRAKPAGAYAAAWARAITAAQATA